MRKLVFGRFPCYRAKRVKEQSEKRLLNLLKQGLGLTKTYS